jgi:AcrR family transcriptional regulator
MPAKILQKRSGEVTRQRILEAAVARFARFSYEEVKLREIARDVGVDVAYVHRSFGSKEQLFAEVFKAAGVTTPPIERALAAQPQDQARVLAENVFHDNSFSLMVRIFACSLSSPQAREVLRTVGLMEYLEPLAAKLPKPALQRAALIAACTIGIRVMRDVLGLEPLVRLSREEGQPLIEGIFQACLDKKLGKARRHGKRTSLSTKHAHRPVSTVRDARKAR